MKGARRTAAAGEAERAARASYGRLLALLSRRFADLAAAEDALSDAFADALRQWPRDGVPERPEAWLLVVARRRIGHALGRRGTAQAGEPVLMLLHDERESTPEDVYGDSLLRLLFACTHPGIAAEAQAPLMLQTVLGLDAARIGAAFLVSAGVMGQRLVRAKRKIRDAGIAFVVPGPEEAASRIGSVLAAIYAAFGTGWEDVLGVDTRVAGLAEEAIWLARLAAGLLPQDPEVMGLLALMLFCHSRRAARRDGSGNFVTLRNQDAQLWSRSLLLEAENLLRSAATRRIAGRFQTEAAIQSLHAQQRLTGERLTRPLVHLYEMLARFAPTTGVFVARAAAIAEDGDPAAAISLLDGIAEAAAYQPWWATMARARWLAGDAAAAAAAATRAAGLTADPSVRAFLLTGGYRLP